MVKTRLDHPEALDIAANIVNSPLTNWFHYRTGAILPYLPEDEDARDSIKGTTSLLVNETWRASELPRWKGTTPEEFQFSDHEDEERIHKEDGYHKPGHGYRWLPLPNTSKNLLGTPIAKGEYNAFGTALYEYEIAVQQHYSLLDNLENNRTRKYWFGDNEGIWNMQYDRYNINFLAIWGHDVALDPPPDGDDEQDYTVTYNRYHTRPLLIDTHSIVAHFSFGAQRRVYQTDLLSRYRAYANERIGTWNNQQHALELHY